jgi:hypothetical protein
VCRIRYLSIPRRKVLRSAQQPVPDRILFVGRLAEKNGTHYPRQPGHALQPDALGVKLPAIFVDGTLHPRLKAGAADRVGSRFHLPRNTEVLEAIYHQLTDVGPSR